jgi:hypothetical protein
MKSSGGAQAHYFLDADKKTARQPGVKPGSGLMRQLSILIP